MNFSSITSIINILIVLFLTTGLLWGIRRGALKSFVRLSFLIFNCIFWVIITPHVSHFILNTNLYPLLNVTIDGHTFTTIADLTNHFLTTSPAILEFVASSPIIATFVEQIPNIVANFVVFILGYFLLKSITLPIYAFVVNRIIKLIQMKSTKQIDPAKKKLRSRFFGAIFGLMQSALTGMILFLPISTLSIVLNGAQADKMFSAPTLLVSQNTTLQQNNNIDAPPTNNKLGQDNLNGFLNIYYNTMLSNTLDAMNLNGLNEFLFKELSTVTVNNQKISLAEELKNANLIMQQTNKLLQKHNITNLSETSTSDFIKLAATMNYNDAEKLLNNLFELKSLRLIGNDVLSYLYNNITPNDTSIEESIQNLPPSISPIVNNLALSLRNGNIKLLKEDVLNLLNFVKTLQKNGLLEVFNNDTILNELEQAKLNKNKQQTQKVYIDILASIINKLDSHTEKTLRDELIAPLFNSPTIRRMTPDIVNMFIEILNESLSLNTEKVNRVGVSWSHETFKLAKLTYDLKEIANDLLPHIKADSLDMKVLLENTSFEKVGTFLNSLRDSQILNYLYKNTFTQIFTNYFIPLDEQHNTLTFEFISLENTNWQEEFRAFDLIMETVNKIIPDTNSGLNNIDASQITLLVEKTFHSNLFKEVLSKSKNLLPQIILGYIDNLPLSEDAEPILNTVKISLQQMSIEQIYDDLITAADMLNIVFSIEEEDIASKLLALNKLQIESLLKQFNTSYIGTKLLPQTINLMIAKINDKFDLNIIYLSDTVTLSSRNITQLANSIENLKIVYNEYLTLHEQQKQNEAYSLKTVIEGLSLQKVGSAVNELRSITHFKYIYNDIVKNVLLNKEFLNEVLDSDILSYLNLTQTEINNLNWETEFNMLKQAAIIGLAVTSIKQQGYNSIRLDLFLQNYGQSKLVKLGLINAVLWLYPDANITPMLNLDLVASANSIGGIAEAVFLFLDFKYNGTIKVELIEKYRIREGIKQIDSNDTLVAFIQDLTQINTINFIELAPLVDTYSDLLEGKEFSIKSFSKYLNVAPLIPWIIELLDKISQGYKMPFYLNIHMQIDLFNTRIKLYGIHLGKQTSTNEDGTTSSIDTDKVIDLMKQLALVPNFITAQFIYDPSFVQPTI